MLDSLGEANTSAALDAAARALYAAAEAAMRAAGPANEMTAMDPILLRTTLATSIVAYLKRLPWDALPPRMLSVADGHVPTALELAGMILKLCLSSSGVDTQTAGGKPAGSHSAAAGMHHPSQSCCRRTMSEVSHNLVEAIIDLCRYP